MGDAELEHDLAGMLRRASALTAAGVPLSSALEQSARAVDGALAGPGARLAERLAIGTGIEPALDAFAAEAGMSDSQVVADVIGVYGRMGGDAATVCARLADAVHARSRLRRDARAATAPARATLRLVIGLPVVVAVGLLILRPQTVAALPAVVLAAAVIPALALLALAAYVLRRLHRHLAAEIRGDSAPPPAASDPTATARRAALAAALVLIPAAMGHSLVAAIGLAGVGVLMAAPAIEAHLRTRREAAQLRLRLAGMCDVARSVLAAGGSAAEAMSLSLRHDAAWISASLGLADTADVTADDLSRFQQSPLAQRHPELRDFLLALELAARHGRNAEPALDTVVRDAAAAQREHLRTVAAAAGPRIQLVTVLLVVPAITWVVLAITAWAFLRQLGALGLA